MFRSSRIMPTYPVCDQSTMTESHHFPSSNIESKNHIDHHRAFTVWITLQQQNVSNRQRLEDRMLAREQREQDLNISREQREHDRLIAEKQRQDAELRRKQDLNMSFYQRETDLLIASDKRKQDDMLATIQRNLSEKQRIHELDIETSRYRDGLLVAYIAEIGDLLLKNNGTLTNDPLTATLVRVKTLTVVRQLDAPRNSHLIQFLYEAGQLTSGNHPLDLTGAELNAIDLTSFHGDHLNIHKLHLSGVYLRNCSFNYRDLTGANFSRSDLSYSHFTNTILNHVDFSQSILIDVQFSNDISLEHANFTEAKLYHSHFISTNLAKAIFVETHVKNCTFILCNMKEIQFVRDTVLNSIQIYNSNMELANLTLAILKNVIIKKCQLSKVILINTTINNSRFIDTNMSQIMGAYLKSYQLVFINVTLANSDLQYADLIEAYLFRANLSNTNLTRADLSDALLSFADMNYAILTEAETHGANMSYAKLLNSNITSKQLDATFSIRGALLPNGSIGRNMNMIMNGHADCKIPLGDFWFSHFMNTYTIIVSEQKSNNCIFALGNKISSFISSENSTIMHQTPYLIKYKKLIEKGQAVSVITGRLGHGAQVGIGWWTSNQQGWQEYMLNASKNILRVRLQSNAVYNLMIKVIFNEQTPKEEAWCDDLEMVIDMDKDEQK